LSSKFRLSASAGTQLLLLLPVRRSNTRRAPCCRIFTASSGFLRNDNARKRPWPVFVAIRSIPGLTGSSLPQAELLLMDAFIVFDCCCFYHGDMMRISGRIFPETV